MRPRVHLALVCVLAACAGPRPARTPRSPAPAKVEAKVEPTQEELARSAMPLVGDWREAIPRITDQKLLADVALGARNFEARVRCAGLIRPERCL